MGRNIRRRKRAAALRGALAAAAILLSLLPLSFPPRGAHPRADSLTGAGAVCARLLPGSDDQALEEAPSPRPGISAGAPFPGGFPAGPALAFAAACLPLPALRPGRRTPVLLHVRADE